MYVSFNFKYVSFNIETYKYVSFNFKTYINVSFNVETYRNVSFNFKTYINVSFNVKTNEILISRLSAFVVQSTFAFLHLQASRGFEPRSLDSESKVLTVTLLYFYFVLLYFTLLLLF